MPNDSGLGGSDLYNLLKNSYGQLNADKFSVAKPQGSDEPAPGSKSVLNSGRNKFSLNNSIKAPVFNSKNAQVTGLTQSAYNKGLSLNSLKFDKLPNFPSTGKNPTTYDNTGTMYDMFERNTFGTVQNDIGIEAGAYSPTPSTKIDNRLIINYKNNVAVDTVSVNGSNVFINKVIPNNKFKEVRFKDPSIDMIVDQLSKDSPACKISYADFLYCKKLGAYPNNRLVILRRFFQPVEDDLASSIGNKNQNPLSVMVTWFDEFPLTITYGENWESFRTGIVQEFSNTFNGLSGIGVTDKSSLLGKVLQTATQSDDATETVAYPWLKVIWYNFIDSLYSNSSNTIPPHYKNVLTEANPNLIRRSVIKKNLEFQLTANLSFTYVMRYVNGIDPHVAMHNIIANAVRMGTSTSVTIFPKGSTTLPKFVSEMNDGKIVTALSNILTQLTEYLSKQGNEAANNLTNMSVADIKNFKLSSIEGQFTRQLFSLYRFRLTAALQADMGTPSGAWHLTVGNPFNPIASVGDLIIKDQMSMTFGKELSYDDQPTEVTFTFNAVSARPRGAQEIEQIFNAGRGRIYVYPRVEDNPDLFLSDENPTQQKPN